jgi:hypothetical protein
MRHSLGGIGGHLRNRSESLRSASCPEADPWWNTSLILMQATDRQQKSKEALETFQMAMILQWSNQTREMVSRGRGAYGHSILTTERSPLTHYFSIETRRRS